MNKLKTGDNKRICITQSVVKRNLLDSEQERLRITTHSKMQDYIADFYLKHKKLEN